MNIKLLIVLAITISSCKTMLLQQTISLFNGENLEGWKVYGTEKWYVEEGILICENGKDEGFGYLATTKNYDDFELNLEFKQHTNGNGGVFVHSEIDGTEIEGWQVEIGAPGHHTGGIHAYDRGWLIKPDAIKDKVLIMGEWNYLRIRVKSNKMSVWLNNMEMTHLVDSKLATKRGQIALQINQGNITKLQWKNINIREL